MLRSIQFVILLSICYMMHGQDSMSLRTYNTSEINTTPDIDGILNDAPWESVQWGERFTVRQPNNGDVPKNQTRFKITYDQENLYIAFECMHNNPEKIENRLSRRDNFPGDWVEINIDSYNDNSTAYSFTLSVSGVKGDEFISSNGNNWDSNWNPIWYGKANINETGWTGEMKIPFSQLRFGKQDEYTWGFNITRRDFSSDERSAWQAVPANVAGFVNNFSHLVGIKNIQPKKQLELQPYVTTALRKMTAEEGNPFVDGTATNLSAGLDGKIGITNDMTLDFTINPDFGQVEADPSALNLNGFQIFFDERRPFFIENANLFGGSFSNLDAGGPFGNDNLFYSRRIGGRPQGFVNTPDGSYVDIPDNTSILGAAKFSGKTKNGLSIGILESITAQEQMEIDNNGDRSMAIVEPFTNYFVGSLQQDFKQGETTIGGTLTAVNRRLSKTGLEDQYHSEALSGGVNLLHTWKDREWQLKGNVIFSNVQGTNQKITNTQQSFEHYFQRPDAAHIALDETKTSLGGHGGTLSLANYGGNDNLSFQGGLTWRSPGLELNDIGFLNTADEINYVQWVGYQFPKAFGIFRRFRINYNHYARWTYDWENLYKAINVNTHASFSNFWSIGGGATYELKDISTKALFGGPKLRQSSGIAPWFYIESDERKSFTYGMNGSGFRAMGSDKDAILVNNIRFWIGYQPTSALRISLNPSYSYQNRAIQNVSYETFKNDPRYITGRIRQETFSLSLRLNYSLTPNVSLEYWGQPFISKGQYSEFKYITDPLARIYTDRFHLYENTEMLIEEGSDLFLIDEDRDGTTDYSFNNPDFNFLQFRSNLVFRWEYKPNSEFFLVWTQGTSNSGDPRQGIFSSLKDDLFSQDTDNIFLLKLTYRFY